MEKKILGFALVVLVAVLATLNVNLTNSEDSSINLDLVNLKTAVADGPEWNHWTDWFDQGFTKDEREEPVACSTSGGGKIKVCVMYRLGGCVEWEYRNSGPVEKINCLHGNVNCTPSSC